MFNHLDIAVTPFFSQALRPITRGLMTLCLAATVSTVHANPTGDASTASLVGSVFVGAVVVGAPLSLAAGGGILLVKSVESAGRGVHWVVENSATGAVTTLEISANAAALSAVRVGTALSSTAHAAGTLLSAGGAVIAIIPSALAQDLFYNRALAK